MYNGTCVVGMFTNAMMFYNQDHDVHKMAMDMYNDVVNSIEVSLTYTTAHVLWVCSPTP